MKFLITGGCGFLGSNLARAVMAQNHDLVVFDNLSRVGSEENLAWLRSLGTFRFVHGDIRNQEDVDLVVQRLKPEVVFHLAGQVAMTTSLERPRTDFLINAMGSLNLLEALRRFSPSAIVVYSSTNKVYGDLEWTEYRETPTRFETPAFPNGFPETIPMEFHSPYGCSKGAADQYMGDYYRMFGIRTVVFRHSSMYGGRQFSTADQGWIGWFCLKALEVAENPSLKVSISGTGKQVRDLLHADDMVSLYFRAVEAIDLAAGKVFNIGGGMQNSFSLVELFHFLEISLGVQLNIERLPARQSDQRVFVADIDKAKNLLNWSPQVTREVGVTRMLEWVKRSV